jgi:hypothetical protein
MLSPFACRNPVEEKSSAPVTPAQSSLPGCARARPINSSSVATFSEAGTAMVMSVFDTRTIGRRSLSL